MFRAVYRTVHRYGTLTDLEGDAELVSHTGGPIIPSYHSHPASIDILCFIAKPVRGKQGGIVQNCEECSMACDSCIDCAYKKEELFCVRMMVDSMMITNFFARQPSPPARSENANARPATHQLGKNAVFFVFFVFPRPPPFFLCFQFFCVFPLFFGFCNPFLVSLKYATPYIFHTFLIF